jgi:hypothetical protein
MFDPITTHAAAISHRHEMDALARYGHQLPARPVRSFPFAALRAKIASHLTSKRPATPVVTPTASVAHTTA